MLQKITISNLLNHRREFTTLPVMEYLQYNTTNQSESQMVAIMAKLKVILNPTVKANYSNSNYVLLSYILQKYNKNLWYHSKR
jgi:CubicO group peptidase (beta-lactamase class C family)